MWVKHCAHVCGHTDRVSLRVVPREEQLDDVVDNLHVDDPVPCFDFLCEQPVNCDAYQCVVLTSAFAAREGEGSCRDLGSVAVP